MIVVGRQAGAWALDPSLNANPHVDSPAPPVDKPTLPDLCWHRKVEAKVSISPLAGADRGSRATIYNIELNCARLSS